MKRIRLWGQCHDDELLAHLLWGSAWLVRGRGIVDTLVLVAGDGYGARRRPLDKLDGRGKVLLERVYVLEGTEAGRVLGARLAV